jgi:hypothetical protein
MTKEDIRRGLNASPEQRLNWLEEANGFINKVVAGKRKKG